MSLVDFSAVPRVAVEFMNDDHREEAARLNAVADALEAALAGRSDRAQVLIDWEELVRFTREHFAREERALSEAGYPLLRVHAAEHQLVLAAMKEEHAAVARDGDLQRLLDYVAQAMPAWFAHHVETTDGLAARWLANHGG
jgi:hemerythrin-like metal-binding protein